PAVLQDVGCDLQSPPSGLGLIHPGFHEGPQSLVGLVRPHDGEVLDCPGHSSSSSEMLSISSRSRSGEMRGARCSQCSTQSLAVIMPAQPPTAYTELLELPHMQRCQEHCSLLARI